MVGLGDKDSLLKVYIGNRPDFPEINELDSVMPLKNGDIYQIGQHCGNGWRKVFNVYAKLIFALKSPLYGDWNQCSSWQQWRDECLLQDKSNSLLLFSKPDLEIFEEKHIHLIMGKGWAKSCLPEEKLYWLNQDFAVIESHNLIVCPYFDYRQLSNIKIVFLCDLLKPMFSQI